MRTIYLTEHNDEIDFANRAAKAFAHDRSLYTYTDGPITAGCFFAVVWGLNRDCVLVLKIDENHEPTNYAEIINTCGGADED
jgi:hypothetical protein